jgi:hypothetical protein
VKVKFELERDEAVLVVAGLHQFENLLKESGKRPATRKKFKADRIDFKKAQRMALEIATKIVHAVEEAERKAENAVVDADATEPECKACGSSSCVCPTEREVPMCGKPVAVATGMNNGRVEEPCELPKGHDGVCDLKCGYCGQVHPGACAP